MSSLALIKDDRYMEHNPGDGHPESPDRLRVIHELIDREFSSLPLIPPRFASESELALVHDPFYIQTVANTEGRMHSRLDPDTGLSARSYEIARLAAGGLLQGVDTLLGTPPLPSGERAGVRGGPEFKAPHSIFAFVRPPGHHAEPDRGMGFCLFNNVAIAAEYAKEKYGLKRILIVDWDLHHGNGTQHAFNDDPGVLYFSSHQYPHYPGSGGFNEVGSGKGEGFTINAPFPPGFGDADYLTVYTNILEPVALEYMPELILVSAGFDTFVKDPLGGMKMTGEGFGALAGLIQDIARRTCDGRVLITLEGGYSPEGLRNGVRAVLQTLLGRPAPAPKDALSAGVDGVMERIVSVHKKYWKSLQ
ncbi:MAG: histone deacetylase [Nitrospirae bacterium]|nr:histone deacetylase [Nitrospirota bacterium]